MMSSDSEDEESNTENKDNKGNKSGSDSDAEPEEFDITNADGSVTRMITTASGPIPLDFSNTKIIQDGKVFNINDLSAFSHEGNSNTETVSTAQPGMGDVATANMNKQLASYNKDGIATAETNRNYATDIGLFKAGMD